MIRPRLTRPSEAVPASPPRPQYVPGRVIVRIKEDVSSDCRTSSTPSAKT